MPAPTPLKSLALSSKSSQAHRLAYRLSQLDLLSKLSRRSVRLKLGAYGLWCCLALAARSACFFRL
ncbi:MAG: hypothetical protein DRN99_03790 [Thermoproteota archaeon]|nr:MAG: hypothetical protein DRN99_03790 [Candidatus Korarchaeota archaeon]